MMTNWVTMLPLVTGLLLIPGSAQAHHGWAEFDEKTEITL